MKRSLSAILCAPFALLVLFVAACSGHGSSSIPVVAPHASGSGAASRQYGVTIRLLVPSKPASTSTRRKRQYVSYETQSGEVIVNGASPVPFAVSSSAPNCTSYEEEVRKTRSVRTTRGVRKTDADIEGAYCSVTVDAPAGEDTFTLKTFDGPLDGSGNVSGNLLSTGTAGQTITSATANEVDLTLDGVVNTLSVFGETNVAPVGTATSVPVFVSANDADGNAIVGPGSYVDASGNPVSISVSDADTSSTTTISGGTLTSSDDDDPLLVYNGNQLHGTIPAVSASAAGFTTASGAYSFAPIFVAAMPNLEATPSGMTAGSDGNIYLLESAPGSDGTNAEFEQHVIGATTDMAYSYVGCRGTGVLSLNPGLITAADGMFYFATDDDCGQVEGAQIVGVTTGGTFTGNTIDDENSQVVLSSSALGYPGSGTNVQLVASVTPGPTATIFKKRNAAKHPNASASSTPSGTGPSFVTSTTSGSTATSYAFANALGLSSTDTYTISSVSGANVITYDANGNAWFPETISDTTAGTTSNVIVEATSATAKSFAIPQPSGGTETITAVTTGSDGNIWYVGNQQFSSGTQTLTIGNVTPGGVFTEYGLVFNNPTALASNAIVEGNDGALYSYLGPSVYRVTHGGSISASPPIATILNGNVTSGLKLSNGDIYFTGTNEYQAEDEEVIRPALYQMLY